METVVVCPVCKNQNSGERLRCATCWASLASGAVVEKEAWEALQRQAGRRRKLRRFAAWGLVALVALGVSLWLVYAIVLAPDLLDPPISSLTATPAEGEWPMMGRDPAHTGSVASDGVALSGELKWRFQTDAPISSSPAVVGGRVYISTGDRRIVALDADSGDLIWDHKVPGPVDSSVAVAGGMVFVGLRDGRVLALNADTGEVRWAFQTNGPVFSPPTIYQGELYAGSGDGKVYALDAMTGEERWSYLTDGWVTASPAVNEDVVAVVSQDTNLYLFDPDTGKVRLDYPNRSNEGTPVFDGDRVFVTDGAWGISAVDWHRKDAPLEKLVRRIKIQLFAWGLVDLPRQRGYLWVFNPPGHSFLATPVVAWDRVYAPSVAGTLFALSTSTGKMDWEFRAKGGLWGPPSVMGRTVFVGDASGRLYALDAFTGEEQWEVKIGDGVLSTPVLANGMLYVASKDGALYAVE